MTATVGAYLRIELGREAEVRAGVDALEGVEAFEVEGDGKLGALIEAEDLDRAHELLVGRVQKVPGVLAAWPVYAHFGDDDIGDDIGDGDEEPPVGLPFADPPAQDTGGLPRTPEVRPRTPEVRPRTPEG